MRLACGRAEVVGAFSASQAIVRTRPGVIATVAFNECSRGAIEQIETTPRRAVRTLVHGISARQLLDLSPDDDRLLVEPFGGLGDGEQVELRPVRPLRRVQRHQASTRGKVNSSRAFHSTIRCTSSTQASTSQSGSMTIGMNRPGLLRTTRRS